MRVLTDTQGRYILAGASGFISIPDSTGVSPTTMDLIDFQSSFAGAKPVVQRKLLSEVGDVPVLFSYTGGFPTMPQARVVHADTNAVVKDWTTLINLSSNGTEGLGTLPDVPMGCYYKIQLQDGRNPTNPATSSNGVTEWGIGVIWLLLGQSNAANTLYAGSENNIVPGAGQSEFNYWHAGSVNGAFFTDAGWHGSTNGSQPANGPTGSSNAPTMAGGSLAFLRILSEALEDQYGYPVPVGLVPWAFNNQSIEEFLPGGSKGEALFGGSGTTVNSDRIGGDIGMLSPRNYYARDFEGVLWHQGEANHNNTPTQYRDKLIQLYQELLSFVSPFGRTANELHFLPAVLGNYEVSQVWNIENIRTAVLQFDEYAAANNWPKARIGWSTIDCSTRTVDGSPDGLHFSDAIGGGQSKSFHRMLQSALYASGCVSFSGRGPKIGTVTRAGNVVTINVVHEGGTALTVPNPANPPTGFYWNTAADFTGTDLFPTMALINGNTQIQATFATDPGPNLHMKHMGAELGTVDSCQPDFTNMVYDNTTLYGWSRVTSSLGIESLGLPLLPTSGSIQVT